MTGSVRPNPDFEDANQIAHNRTVNCMFPALAVWCFPFRDMLVALSGDREDFVVTRTIYRIPLVYFSDTACRGRSSTQ